MTSTTATRILTGITTSGTPHLGNYVGAIRPAIAASRATNVESFYFLADYHALVKIADPARVRRSTLEIAASWLACGLDPERVWFYRQSDIPEIPELTWLLTCVTGKGLLNRAHAYKAAVDRNIVDGNDPDAGVTAGLFMYPVLMAADILLFNANKVPVGRDQVQHIEMARDIGARFNHLYGEYFALPEAVIEEQVATLPGLDGRKMSKSYDNTIPLFASPAELKKAIAGIVTDSRAPGEPKEPEGSAVFALYQAFASVAETEALRAALLQGMGWGDAKQKLFARIDAEIAPFRERYAHFTETAEGIAGVERLLRAGAVKARDLAKPLLRDLRKAVGLCALDAPQAKKTALQESDKKRKDSARKRIKQFKGEDGLFRFKVADISRHPLLESKGFRDAAECATALAYLQHQYKSDSAWRIEPSDKGSTLQLIHDNDVLASSNVSSSIEHLDALRVLLSQLIEFSVD
jgi:tryptophanyl-tRNA synthetase